MTFEQEFDHRLVAFIEKISQPTEAAKQAEVIANGLREEEPEEYREKVRGM